MLQPLEKTATGCWNPTTSQTKSNLYACGTVAGAFDASFSSNTELEIYEHSVQHDHQAMQKLVSFSSPLRFCKLDWSITPSHANYGLLAGGMEGGVVNVWNVDLLIGDRGQSKESSSTAVHHSQKAHEGMVKGVSFNPVQTNVLATGASNADICVWDMNAPGKTVAPGPKSAKLDDISDLVWNPKVQHILASASTNGSIVIWDLNQKREVIQMTIPNKYSVSSICWNPDVPTQLFTACEDDAMPMIYGWDLRNAHAPEKVLSGHKKGILCMDWCSKDSELLASAGKDNCILLWNPKTGERTGQLPGSDNWIFDVKFSPKNPDLITSSSFDGKINFYSLQELAQHNVSSFAGSVAPAAEVTKIPRWLKRPVGCAFSFNGKLYSFSSSTKGLINSQTVPEDESFFNTVVELETAISTGHLGNYCEKRSGSITSIDSDQPIESFWFMLAVGFDFAGKKQKLLKLLGLAREELQERLRKMSHSIGSEESDSLGDGPSSIDATSSSAQSFDSSPNSPRMLQPHSESEFSKFITQSLIVGDFESAVSYCRHANKWADALLIAQCSSAELLEKTQQKYVSQFQAELPYLPLAKSILSKDLSSIVESYPLSNWKELLAILCTYATEEQFKSLVSQLGNKLLQSNSLFAAICCFSCSFDFVNFTKSIYQFLPDILTEDYVQFIATLNFACGNILFTNQQLEEREFILKKYLEYSMIICKEGLISYALMYCQSAEGVSLDDPKTILFKYRLYSLCSSANKKYSIEPPFTVVSPFVVEQKAAYVPTTGQAQPQYVQQPQQFNPYDQPYKQPFVQQQQQQQPYPMQMPYQGGMQNLTQTFSSASLAQHIPQQPLQMMPSPPQQATSATPSGTTQPYPGKSAWNDVPFASSTQQTVRKPLVVTPPQQPTPRMQPQIAPPVPTQPMQVQTPRMQPQTMPGGASAVHPGQQGMPQQPGFPPMQPHGVAPQQPGFPPMQPHGVPPQQQPGFPPVQSPSHAQQPMQQQTPRMQPQMVPPPQMQPQKVPPQSIGIPTVQQSSHLVGPPPVHPIMPPQVVQHQVHSQPISSQQMTPRMQPMAVPPQQQQQHPTVQQPIGQMPSTHVPPSGQMSSTSLPLSGQMPIGQPTVPQPHAVNQLPSGPSIMTPPQTVQPPTTQPPASRAAPSQTPTEQRPPSVQSVGSVKKSGDISNIPPSLLPIHNSFRSLLDFCKQRAPPAHARLIEDCEKRLITLFDRMNQDQFSKNEQVIGQSLELAKCISDRNLDQAMTIQSSLYSSHFDDVGNWMVAIKRLIEMAKKI